MSAQEVQVTDSQELTPVHDYKFTGDNRTVENKYTFIHWYRIKATVYHAALAAQVARSTVYKWMDEDSQFAQAVADSFEDAADVMETSTYEDALGTKDKPGNALLKMFWLKAHRGKFRDRVQVDVGQVQSDIEEMVQRLGLKQLPPTTTSFIDTEYSQSELEYQPLPVESDNQQKEDSLESE